MNEEYSVSSANIPKPGWSGREVPFLPDQPSTVATISDERLLAVIAKVENYYEKEGLDDLVKRSILTHPVVEGAISADPSLGTSGLKHLRQNSSLLGHLKATGAMDPPFQSKAAIFEPFLGSETETFLF